MIKFNWHFPPTTNKQGYSRDPYDIKTIALVETDLFDEPVIAMSDIHSHTPELLPMLNDFINYNEFVVLTVGDMAGIHVFGADGDPTPEYQYLADRAKEFYFVQGNHDLPDKQNKQKLIKNKAGINSYIEDGSVQKTIIGSIGGVNGTISDKTHPHKMPHEKFIGHLKSVLSKKPHILMTHETPSISTAYTNGDRYIGKIELFDTVNGSKSKPHIYMYGHCHHPDAINTINGVNYINVDGRVIIFLPISKGGRALYDDPKFFKSKFKNMYSPSAKKL